jgi:hypothetical protein
MFGCREDAGKTSPWLHWRRAVTHQTPAPSSAPTVANPPKYSSGSLRFCLQLSLYDLPLSRKKKEMAWRKEEGAGYLKKIVRKFQKSRHLRIIFGTKMASFFYNHTISVDYLVDTDINF